jgi:hypothetical protein
VKDDFKVLDRVMHVLDPVDLHDTNYPEATAHSLGLGLDDPSKRKILWDNCARLYGFPRD